MGQAEAKPAARRKGQEEPSAADALPVLAGVAAGVAMMGVAWLLSSNDEEQVPPAPAEQSCKGELVLEDSKEGLAMIRATDASSSLTPQSMATLPTETKDENLCCICLDTTRHVVFVPCGHFVCCGKCAPQQKLCPICRSAILKQQNVFYS